MTEITAPSEHRPIAVLGWAAFLAVSWTWCIGMFLPVILLRDYGVFAWVAFALPNVIGAAAMGWVLYRPGVSERLVGHHVPAMAAFSVVTILFHVLFFGWVVRWLGGGWTFVTIGAGIAVACFWTLFSKTAALILSVAVWLASIATFATAVRHTDIASAPFGSTSLELVYLTPAFILGFLLCPYLDLTFHRARQSLSPYGSVAGFTLGFGVLFLAMIVFTLWYGPMTIPPDALRTGGSPRGLGSTAALAVVLHMAAQGGFTVAAHAVELVRKLRRSPVASRRGSLAGLLFGIPILIAAFILADPGRTPAGQEFYYRELSAPEIGYRLFMSFYGLFAPAYVWLFLVPYRYAAPTPRRIWVVYVVTLALAGPTFWLGFIERQMVWVPLGVAIIMASRFVARVRPT